MTAFDFARLRRYPDVEAPNLFASDATDRLLLDTAADALTADARGLVVIGDRYGALTLGAADRFGSSDIRSQQDPLTGELALAANAERFGLSANYQSMGLEAGLFCDARVILIQAPKSLDALRQIVELIGHEAPGSAQVFLGGRVKHLSRGVNIILSEVFDTVQAGLARQKSRVISARQSTAENVSAGTGPGIEPARSQVAPSFPKREWHADLGLFLCAHGGAFAGTKVDVGTRRLLTLLDRMAPGATNAIDLGCGTGVLAAALAKARPQLQVLATDQSRAAVDSALATMALNELTDRVTVHRDNAMSTVADSAASLIVCNPPFHLDNAVHDGGAVTLIEAAGRVLSSGGELWTVHNAHLDYRPILRTHVGKTEVVHRDPKFSVTVSRKS